MEFTERDIWVDPTAIDDLTALPSYSTPTTVIDGEVIIGFEPQELRERLGI